MIEVTNLVNEVTNPAGEVRYPAGEVRNLASEVTNLASEVTNLANILWLDSLPRWPFSCPDGTRFFIIRNA